MRAFGSRSHGGALIALAFDLLVVLSLLMNFWELVDSQRVEGKVDAIGRELTALNTTLEERTSGSQGGAPVAFGASPGCGSAPGR
jgi:hypothetical protein